MFSFASGKVVAGTAAGLTTLALKGPACPVACPPHNAPHFAGEAGPLLRFRIEDSWLHFAGMAEDIVFGCGKKMWQSNDCLYNSRGRKVRYSSSRAYCRSTGLSGPGCQAKHALPQI